MQTSRPERTRSLPNRNLDLSDNQLPAVPPAHLSRLCCLEKQRQGFHQVRACFFEGRALTGDIQFRTQRDEAIVLRLNDSGQALRSLHNLGLHVADCMNNPVSWVLVKSGIAPGASCNEWASPARGTATAAAFLTFDKDFGELAVHRGLPASFGVILWAGHHGARAMPRIFAVLRSATGILHREAGMRGQDVADAFIV